MSLPDLLCRACGQRTAVAALAWQCPCGGMFDVAEQFTALSFSAEQLARNSLWRYESVLPVGFPDTISMAEGQTPLLRSAVAPNVRLKLDFLMPTLSFKDRGAVQLAALAARLGVSAALTDSSGNAGTAAAAYFRRAGIPLRVYVPAHTAAAKLAQMRAHGAEVSAVDGTRADAAAAARRAAAQPGVFYASHVYHPYLLHGVKTYGYELWEQCGRRLPEVVVVPVGNGTLALGCYLAFSELVASGRADRLPVLVGVQASACAPIARADAAAATVVTAVDPDPTCADGIAIANPPRGAQILAAIRNTGGLVVEVSDAAITAARAELASEGWYVEPTSAVCWAAVRADNPARELLGESDVIVPLCGAGLKVTA